MHPFAPLAGDLSGTNAFRFMPTDDLVAAPSRAHVGPEAGGHGWSLRYTWVHPEDGEQDGVLLVGSPADDGEVTAALMDSWHQKPAPATLTGAFSDGLLVLSMSYAGDWGWQIVVGPDGDALGMTMSNVVPAGVEGAEPGPYDVMVARWEPVAG